MIIIANKYTNTGPDLDLGSNITYRSLAAIAMAVLVLQVFVLQGIHQLLAHSHVDEVVCDLENPHIHSRDHGHLTCDICLFHFTPSELQEIHWAIRVQERLPEPSRFAYYQVIYKKSGRKSFLRGPPLPPA